MKGKKVFVGLSGGVDSAVSAALLVRGGYDVTGVFMKGWYPDFLHCDWKEERRDAMRVAAHLDIPFLTLDCEEEYKTHVVDYMLAEYDLGRTPNPDVMCNKYVKFGSFLKEAKLRDADFIATGHYAVKGKRDNHGHTVYTLNESPDPDKDQSYFLWTLTQKELLSALFPVGKYKKDKVRSLAREFALPVSEKKDSQGICFLGDVDMKEFLKRSLSIGRGNVLNLKGDIIGFHEGARLYTMGERHGFTLLKQTPSNTPLYVISKDITTNTITVAPRDDRQQKGIDRVALSAVNWVSSAPTNKAYTARIRYHQKPQEVTVTQKEDLSPARAGGAQAGKTEVIFKVAQEGLSFGQSLVLYDGYECIGGGIIEPISHPLI
jgi:tRNA-specific 2-thiouridylase